ncbi:MAG: DUF6691 family protein [Bacteroidota bacterium]
MSSVQPIESTPQVWVPNRPAHAPVECIDITQAEQTRPGRRPSKDATPLTLGLYALLGAYLGLVFTKSQVISWFKIYEMFRFESFHMFGLIGSAVATAAVSVWLIKRFNIKTVHGEPIRLSPKQWGRSSVPGARYWMGGLTFGLGWALLGACPGPLVALLGGGVSVLVAALIAALAGTWAYALLRDRLPH